MTVSSFTPVGTCQAVIEFCLIKGGNRNYFPCRDVLSYFGFSPTAGRVHEGTVGYIVSRSQSRQNSQPPCGSGRSIMKGIALSFSSISAMV